MNKAEKNSKSVLVTGGAGFIGSHLVDVLVEEGYFVHVIDRAEEPWQKLNAMRLVKSPNVKFYFCDIRDREQLTPLFELAMPEKVFHLAAESHVDKSIISPELFLKR